LDLSVFVRQKKGRHAWVGFCDDPELHSGAERVRGLQTPAVLEAEFVLATVVLVNITPIASEMTNKKSQRVVAAPPTEPQRQSWRRFYDCLGDHRTNRLPCSDDAPQGFQPQLPTHACGPRTCWQDSTRVGGGAQSQDWREITGNGQDDR
jgi:hypothetical protein